MFRNIRLLSRITTSLLSKPIYPSQNFLTSLSYFSQQTFVSIKKKDNPTTQQKDESKQRETQESSTTDEGIIGKVTKKLKPNEPILEKASHMAEDIKHKVSEKMGIASEKLDEFKEAASEKVSHLKEEAIHMKDVAKEKIHDFTEKAGEKLHDIKEKAGEKIDVIKEKAEHAKDSAKETITNVKDSVMGSKESTSSSGQEQEINKSSMAGDQFQSDQFQKGAQEKIHEWRQKGEEKINEFSEKGQEIKESAKDKMSDIKDQASEKASTIKDKLGDIAEKAKETASRAKEAIKEKLTPEETDTTRTTSSEPAEKESFVNRAAQKLVDITEKFTGRPVVEHVHYKKADAEGLREEITKEESLRADEIAREKFKPEKDMFDLKDQDQWNHLAQTSEVPILIDFYKQDCVDCRRLYPKLMDKFKDSKEEWLLVGANLDRVESFAKSMNIQQIPSLIIFHKGKVVETITDAEPNVERIIEKVLDLSHKS